MLVSFKSFAYSSVLVSHPRTFSWKTLTKTHWYIFLAHGILWVRKARKCLGRYGVHNNLKQKNCFCGNWSGIATHEVINFWHRALLKILLFHRLNLRLLILFIARNVLSNIIKTYYRAVKNYIKIAKCHFLCEFPSRVPTALGNLHLVWLWYS